MTEHTDSGAILPTKHDLGTKRKSIESSYLTFRLQDRTYGIPVQYTLDVLNKNKLVVLSHMLPPVVGLLFYRNKFIPTLDFAGYQPHNTNNRLLVLKESLLPNQNRGLFALIVDEIFQMQNVTTDQITECRYPFYGLLPSYYYTKINNQTIHLLEIHDLARQIEYPY